MTDSRSEVLGFAARHDVFIARHVELALSLSSSDVGVAVEALVGAGELRAARFSRDEPAVYWITEAGLAPTGSRLPPPAVSLEAVRSRLGATWAAVHAADQRFDKAVMLTRREQSARDARRSATSGRPIGLRVGGVAADTELGLHYPDVLLQFPRAWMAAHVALNAPNPRDLVSLLTAYGADARYQRVVFLVEEERVALEIELVAESLGLAELVRAQWMDFRL